MLRYYQALCLSRHVELKRIKEQLLAWLPRLIPSICRPQHSTPILHPVNSSELKTELTMAGFPSPTKTWYISLAGKFVIITGGGSGIGLAISKALALAGASRLAISGRRTEVLAKAEAEIKDLVGEKTKVFTFSADVGNKEQIDKAIAQIWLEFGGRVFDILVNNAGYYTGLRPIGYRDG